MNDLFENEMQLFPTSYNEIEQRIRGIAHLKYGRTRNFVDDAVTHLSPYISSGVISTKQILSEILKTGYQSTTIEKFIQELAWRDYWQQVWISKGDNINSDLKKNPISNTDIPEAFSKTSTEIEAIDTAITTFYKATYLHNHLQMYITSMACSIAQSHWKLTALWMYYHLLDADWASNSLSWQWGSRSEQ